MSEQEVLEMQNDIGFYLYSISEIVIQMEKAGLKSEASQFKERIQAIAQLVTPIDYFDDSYTENAWHYRNKE